MAPSSDQPDNQGPAAKIGHGPVQGKAMLRPEFQSLGRNRPFGPGEYLHLPDGNWASEMTYSLPYQGKFAVLPGLWLMNGVPTHVSEDQATELAQQSGLQWPTFDTQENADQYANQREARWQTTPFGRSDYYPALWSRPWPPQY